MPDAKLDFSDIPESTTRELQRARRIGRAKAARTAPLIAIRIEPKLLLSIRRLASRRHRPYQMVINDLLQQALRSA